MEDTLIKYWPFLSSLGGILLGGAVNWAITKEKVESLFKAHDELEKRVHRIEDRTDSDRLAAARLEVKVDDVRAAILRLEQK
jgi:hypothetical protein